MPTALFQDDQLYRCLLDNLAEGVYFTDTHRRIQYWNRGAEQITGYEAEEVLGRSCANNILVHTDFGGKSICHGACPLAATMKDTECRTERLFLRHKEGHRIPVVTTTVAILDAAGVVIGGLESFHDVTTEMAALAQVEELKAKSLLCSLTGVGNRRYAEQMLESKFEEMRRNQSSLGIVFMDVDRFKAINDRHGHKVGDLALKIIARTLSNAMRGYDFLGRWGGEEFIAILPNMQRPQLSEFAERLRALVEESSAAISNGSLVLTISLGAVVAGPEDDIGDVLTRADLLMYRSKQNGRNQVTMD
ncbi:MAG: sensor domain-containing diguanylate cyclase [Candidatus Competibacteraceae bacterium]|nr:sensor domain-containing diguanylate cyclase [Candidatus Competibacteraceae bacterium]